MNIPLVNFIPSLETILFLESLDVPYYLVVVFNSEHVDTELENLDDKYDYRHHTRNHKEGYVYPEGPENRSPVGVAVNIKIARAIISGVKISKHIWDVAVILVGRVSVQFISDCEGQNNNKDPGQRNDKGQKGIEVALYHLIEKESLHKGYQEHIEKSLSFPFNTQANLDLHIYL